MEELLLWTCVLFAGIWIGQKLERMRWKSNAGQPYRIEADGRLFKVNEVIIHGNSNKRKM